MQTQSHNLHKALFIKNCWHHNTFHNRQEELRQIPKHTPAFLCVDVNIFHFLHINSERATQEPLSRSDVTNQQQTQNSESVSSLEEEAKLRGKE